MGDTIVLGNSITGNKVASAIYNSWLGSNAGKTFSKMFGEGGKYGDVKVVINMTELDAGTRGETEAYAVDKSTGEDTRLIDQKSIDAHKDRGGDTSNLKSTLGKNENLKFNLTINEVDEVQNYVIKNREETLTHEFQHVLLGTLDAKKDGSINMSGRSQHKLMKTNSSLIQQRFNTLKRARPDLPDNVIREAVTEFEN